MIRREEKFAAEIFERFAPEAFQRDVGPRTRRNGEDSSGILVDWTYDSTTPAVALEVTAIHLPGEPQVVAEVEKNLRPELERIARDEALGSWLVNIDVAARIKTLLPPVMSLMREGASFHVGDYSSQDIEKARGKDLAKIHHDLEAIGLRDLVRREDGHGPIECVVSGGGPEIVPFTGRLDQVVQENRAKLLALDGYDTHLAVVVFDFQVSKVPERTPPPNLDGIGALWVIHSWQGPTGRPEAWMASQDSRDWKRWAWN